MQPINVRTNPLEHGLDLGIKHRLVLTARRRLRVLQVDIVVVVIIICLLVLLQEQLLLLIRVEIAKLGLVDEFDGLLHVFDLDFAWDEPDK